MSSSPSAVYLITGANRGIGLGFVDRVGATHADAFIYAGVRKPTESLALLELQSKYPDRIAIVRYVSGDAESNVALAKEIEERHGRVDTVVANAGIAKIIGPVLDTPAPMFLEHFTVNALGAVVLFQSVHHVLKASKNPRFAVMNSAVASLDGPFTRSSAGGLAAYGASKAALNYTTRKIHFENEWLTAFSLAPGVVATDMLTEAIEHANDPAFEVILRAQAISVETSTSALLKIIDESTRVRTGGEFMNYDGNRFPW